ncbi:class I SAM-dependent methyltransferase [Nocardioides jejuensis]|uniref:Class I SAM-dependent methyltransferase n=1 Tax=Nocardioides jejuensis TaxID=2502782 RepID=A0A4R1CD18_9ACTN|nr:class I SAM-dependent methyltransferase [Nocardioides jejuensis]TCJ28631.1 class I SAM-dependent methyltransferase [Nocardioides jejuensis]
MDATHQTTDEVAERLFGSLLGMLEVLSAFLGDRLGWYRSLANDGPATAPELAARTGTAPRYAREWLEQQAVCGLLTVERDGEPDERVFSIPAAVAEVMTDASSLAYIAPVTRLFGAVGPLLPDLLNAYRSGGGVSWSQLGAEAREAQGDQNRPWFSGPLGDALAGVPAVHDVLSQLRARVLDVGCGVGWSTIGLARAYPEATFVGVDIDPPTVALAQQNVAEAGLADRVRIVCADADSLDALGSFDMAFAFECVHDMPRPVEVLAAARKALLPGGSLVVMDEAVAEAFAPLGDEIERVMYGFSLLVCLPDSMCGDPTVATGTVMRPATLQSYAEAAGFSSFAVLPIEGFSFFRFYRLSD